MPKVHNTAAQRRQQLFDRISPDGVFERGPLSKSPFTPLNKISEKLRREMKEHYQVWFDSWVRDDAEKFILNKKNKP